MALSEMFGISSGLLAEGTRKLNPKEELYAFDGKPVFGKVPASLQKLGITESRDVIKLIASTGPFDARLLEQSDQDGPRPATRGLLATSVTGTLNRLMSRLQTRSLDSDPDRRNHDSPAPRCGCDFRGRARESG
jgi:hypothetical protein